MHFPLELQHIAVSDQDFHGWLSLNHFTDFSYLGGQDRLDMHLYKEELKMIETGQWDVILVKYVQNIF